MEATKGTTFIVLTVCVMLALALVGQAVTDASTPLATTGTGQAIGRAGFAYLTGFRVFAASVLWNRLEDVLHGYYHDVPLDDQTFIMPSIRMITALDPQLVDAYYVVGFVLASRGETETAFQVAREGVSNNPDSGLLRMSYAQILFLFGDESDMAEAIRQADYAMDHGVWRDAIEQHDSYGILSFIYKRAGDRGRFDTLQREIERLDAEIGDAIPAGGHDHDGDGVPDH